jgi:hypothetical protein
VSGFGAEGSCIPVFSLSLFTPACIITRLSPPPATSSYPML